MVCKVTVWGNKESRTIKLPECQVFPETNNVQNTIDKIDSTIAARAFSVDITGWVLIEL